MYQLNGEFKLDILAFSVLASINKEIDKLILNG